MCVTPMTVKVRGLSQKVSCGKCWQCRDNRVKDLVGRCIAEDRYSVASTVVTLTYGTDRSYGTSKTTTLSAAILTYSDVQKYFKRLRNDGYEFRYVLCGEKGKLKGRCHWHIIFFWQNKVPPHPPIPAQNGVRWWHDPHWTGHPDSAGGHSHWDRFTYKTARYVCKYLMKDEDDESAQSLVRWSKGRAGSGGLLGSPFFRELARRHVAQGLPPAGRRYSFADCIDPRTQKPQVFYMNDATLDFFVASYVEQWLEAYGEHPMERMYSETLMLWMDRMARRMTVDDVERRKYIPAPKGAPVDLQSGEVWTVLFDEPLNTFKAVLGDVTMYWSQDEWGNRSWQAAIGMRPASAFATKPMGASSGSRPRLTSERYRRESNGA